MTNAAARVLEILELLQGSGTRTVADLAVHLGVDERTVRRSVERMREIDMPVVSVRGRHGGYRLAPGYRMPPLMLNEDEVVAVVVALAAAQTASPVPGSAQALATASAKLAHSLPRHLADRARALLETAALNPSLLAPAADPSIILTAADAIRSRRPLQISYRSRDDRISVRSIQPHDLVASNGRWYLVGLDSLARSRRTFRIDRVRWARLLPGTFPAPAEHDPVSDLIDHFARADYRYRVAVRVRGSHARIRRHLPASVATIEDLEPDVMSDDHWRRVVIHAEQLDWIPPVLLALDGDVVIEEPEELRDLVAASGRRLTAFATA